MKRYRSTDIVGPLRSNTTHSMSGFLESPQQITKYVRWNLDKISTCKEVPLIGVKQVTRSYEMYINTKDMVIVSVCVCVCVGVSFHLLFVFPTL